MADGRRFGSGLGFLQEQNKALGGGSRGSGFRKLWLKDGETAQFYFVTDGPEMVVPLIHIKTISMPNRKPFTVDVLCNKMSADDATPCQYCDAPPIEREGKTDAQFPGPFPRMVGYVYVSAIFHPQRDPKNAWEPITDAAGTVKYKETVDSVFLLIASYKLQEAVKSAYAGDVTEDGYDPAKRTLKDRPYRMVRTGSGGSSQTQLIPSTNAGYPEAVTAAAADLPPLFDTIEREFTDSRDSKAAAPKGAVAPSDDDIDAGPSVATALPGAMEDTTF